MSTTNSLIEQTTLSEMHWYKRPYEDPSFWRPGPSGILGNWVPPKLKAWFISNTKEQIAQKLQETGKIGTDLHKNLETMSYGGVVLPEGLDKTLVDGYGRLAEKYQITPEQAEIRVVSDKYGFGGSIDLVATLTDNKGERKRYVCDYKTGYVSSKAPAQLSCYAAAYQELNGGEIPGLCVFAIPRDGKEPRAIFYHDYKFWFTGFLGLYNFWRIDTYRELKKTNWMWLDKNPLDEYYKSC